MGVRTGQALGRNLEGLVGRSQELKAGLKDDYVSVEHLLLAFLDDRHFGQQLLQGDQLTKEKLDAAIKEARPPPPLPQLTGLQCPAMALQDTDIYAERGSTQLGAP